MSPRSIAAIHDWLPFVACAAALGLACYAGMAHRSGMAVRRLAVWLALAGFIQAVNGLAVWMYGDQLFWRRLGLVGELLQPSCLLWVLLPPLRRKAQTVLPGTLQSARWRTGAIAVLGLLFGLFAWMWQPLLYAPGDGAYGIVFINPPGRALYSFILIGLVLGLAQIEQLMRTLPDRVRYQLKFILLGVGALAAYEVYETSQVLLLGGFRLEDAWVGSFAVIVTVGMVALGLRRLARGPVRGTIYVSPQVAYGSLTFLFIGLYLLATGLLGEWVRYTGSSVTEGLRVLVFFFAAVGLAVLVASRTVRTQARQFVARNFYRSPYDYRAKWLEVTEAYRMTHSCEEILDQTLYLLSGTVGAPRLSIWMRSDTDGRFLQARSVNVEMPTMTLDPDHPLVSRLQRSDYPIALRGLQPGNRDLEELLRESHAVLGVPIRSGDHLLAFILLSADPRKASYGVDDCDLLKAIAHHVGVLLSHARLADERRASAQVEAVNHLAAFCVHDLKNLAGRLSLVVQNAQTHGLEPEFQASAMRTIATTVDKMLALIAKLSPRSRQAIPRQESNGEIVNVAEVIADCVASLPEAPGVRITVSSGQASPVRFEREQLGQVLTNLVLNARQAIGERGEIRIQTIQRENDVAIVISDDGPGIPADRLRHIFRPFQTTKPGGLGLGLYQCKRIVEAYKGSVYLESESGRGTTVRVVLPLIETPAPA